MAMDTPDVLENNIILNIISVKSVILMSKASYYKINLKKMCKRVVFI